MQNRFTQAAMAVLCIAMVCAASAQTTTKKPVQKPAPPKPAAHHSPAPAAMLTDEQMSIAQIVTTGRISCSDGHSVTITPDAKIQGAFDLVFGKTKYDVVPMPTQSGAVRLEDRKTGIVFMQLANKSMLFNERAGKRLADDCINASQQAVADQMKLQPGNSLLDSPSR